MSIFMHHVVFCLILTTVLVTVNKIAAPASWRDRQTLSAYECGFESMTAGSAGFDLQFYGLALVFLIFDIEICYFVPIVLEGGLDIDGLFFLIFVTMGFLIEWGAEVLDWRYDVLSTRRLY